jgi:hypothetical protein
VFEVSIVLIPSVAFSTDGTCCICYFLKLLLPAVGAILMEFMGTNWPCKIVLRIVKHVQANGAARYIFLFSVNSNTVSTFQSNIIVFFINSIIFYTLCISAYVRIKNLLKAARSGKCCRQKSSCWFCLFGTLLQ